MEKESMNGKDMAYALRSRGHKGFVCFWFEILVCSHSILFYYPVSFFSGFFAHFSLYEAFLSAWKEISTSISIL